MASFAPLFPLEKQFQAKDGRNNTGGWLKVYLAATDDPADTYSDYLGTRNPERIILDDNGRATVICDKAKAYRLEVYDISGALLWTEEPVYCSGTGGGGVSVTRVISTDGSIGVESSTEGSVTTYDLSMAPPDSDEFLEWVKCSSENIANGNWYPVYVEGSMETYTGQGLHVGAGKFYHMTATVKVDPTGSGVNYETLSANLEFNDGTETSHVTRRNFDIDNSCNDPVLCEFSYDFKPEADGYVYFDIEGVNAFEHVSVELQVHRIYSGINAVPDTCATKQWVEEYYSELSRDTQSDWTENDSTKPSYIKHRPDLSLYVTDSELENILEGYATTSDLSQYATKSELTYGLSGKQDVLTAGENITIVDNVISSTGGSTYTAGTGIDITGDVINVDTTTIATKSDLSGKQDTISDLQTIREGAAAGATAVQPAALNDYATTSAMNTALAGKQDTISDLQTIREGAAAGATAVQPATLNDYATTSAMNTALAGKQDTLTAGSNIQISGSTISATDTTYTAGTGLSLTGTEFSVDSTTVAMKSDLPDLTPYVTDTELSTILQGYQTALTAGSNITISNGTISATDTTYTAGTGLNLSNGEFSVDTSTIATQSDLSGKQDTLTAGTGITITNNTISCTASFTQQQADWAQTDTSAVDYIQNKPTIPTVPVLKELVAGNNITLTESESDVTVACSVTVGTVTV